MVSCSKSRYARTVVGDHDADVLGVRTGDQVDLLALGPGCNFQALPSRLPTACARAARIAKHRQVRFHLYAQLDMAATFTPRTQPAVGHDVIHRDQLRSNAACRCSILDRSMSLSISNSSGRAPVG